MSDESYDAAVLFVHGIGDQRRGETLADFGGCMVSSARVWFHSGHVVALPLAPAPHDPAHAAYHVTRDEGSLRVLLAESHWAGEVQPPPWGKLMRWLFSAVPFVVQRALDAWMRRSSRRIDAGREGLRSTSGGGEARRWRRWLAHAPLVLLAAAARVLANVAAVALSTAVVLGLWLLGLAARRTSIRDGLFGARGGALPDRLKALIVGFVGDSYALLNDCATATRVVGRVAGDLHWLEQRAPGTPVVIVAHSQGSEIVRRVLLERTVPVAGLVTFGSGIAKLYAVRRLRAQRGRAWQAFGLRVISAACVVAAVIPTRPEPIAATAALLGLAAILLTAARRRLRQVVGADHAGDALGAIGGRNVARWTDLHASHDLVSEGDLPVDTRTAGGSRTIVNRRSLILDHITYPGNVEGWQAAVAREIDRVATPGAAASRPPALVAAEASRTRAISVIYAIRLLTMAAVVALWLVLDVAFFAAAAIAIAAVALYLPVALALHARAAARTSARLRSRT